MNLDKLYQERFQSFEMEPSSGAAASMLQKLKIAKTLSMVKWIVGGILIAVTAATITLLSITSEETGTLPINIENKIESNEPNKQINSTEKSIELNNIEPKAEKESELNSIEINNQETTLSQDELGEKSDESETAVVYEKNIETVQTVAETTSLDAVQLEEAVNEFVQNKDALKRDRQEIAYLTGKNQYLEIPSISPVISKSNLKLNTPNRFQTSNSRKSITSKIKNQELSGETSSPNREKGASILDGYLDFHFAPLIWQNNANMKNPDLDTTWSYSLNQSPQLSYEFGMAFQLHHQKLPIFLQLGVDYQILKGKVDFQLSRTFEDPNLSYWTYDSIWNYQEVLDTFYIIIDDNQFIIDSIFTTDTVLSDIDSLYNPVSSTEESKLSHLNTYRYLNIPLLFGYQFESKNQKWSYQFMAGPAISINLKNEGYYYTNTGNFEQYSGKMTPSLSWNIYAAANINYRWKKWKFFAQPEFQYQLNESELSQQIPRRKYQFYKLKFGIRYQLF